MPPGTLVIANPSARGGTLRSKLGTVEPKLRESLGAYELEWTRAPRDAERIVREGVRAGAERVIVAGGDGTVSEVVSGLLGAGLGGQVALGILPLGTGGDLPRTLGIPRAIDAAIDALAHGKSRRIDAGRVDYRSSEGEPAHSYFVNIASLGISGLTTQLVNRAPKALGGRLSFLLGTTRAILQYQRPPVSLRLDGEEIHAGPLVLATAANGRYFGGGMHVAPEARPDDGLLDVVVVPGVSRTRLLAEMPRIYRGTHIGVHGIHCKRGRVLEGDAGPAEVWIEVDGEPLGRLPARFEVLPAALTLLGCG